VFTDLTLIIEICAEALPGGTYGHIEFFVLILN